MLGNPRRLLRIIFPAYVLLVVFLSLTPDGPDLEAGDDKWAHYGAYMLMALFGMLIPESGTGRTVVFVFVMTIGAVLEWLQGFSPVRTPDLWDALANVAGATTGTAAWWVAMRFSSRRD